MGNSCVCGRRDAAPGLPRGLGIKDKDFELGAIRKDTSTTSVSTTSTAAPTEAETAAGQNSAEAEVQFEQGKDGGPTPATAEPDVEQLAAASAEGKVLSADAPQEPSTADGLGPEPAGDVPVEASAAGPPAADEPLAGATGDEVAQDAAQAEVQHEQGEDPDAMGEPAPVIAHASPKDDVTPVTVEHPVGG